MVDLNKCFFLERRCLETPGSNPLFYFLIISATASPGTQCPIDHIRIPSIGLELACNGG